MKILGAQVVRVKEPIGSSVQYYPYSNIPKIFTIAPSPFGQKINSRMALLHEIGHVKAEGGHDWKKAEKRNMAFWIGVCPLWLLQEEAAAWKWAVKEHRRRYERDLNEEEKATIRHSIETYVRGRTH